MRCPREQINGCRFFDFISKLLERGAVARERRWVAGDVYYPVGSHACGGFNRLLRAALARRVEDYYLRALALAEKLFGGFARVRADEPRVLYSVCGGVLFASSIAGATVSMPMSSSALSAIESPIVPAPQ